MSYLSKSYLSKSHKFVLPPAANDLLSSLAIKDHGLAKFAIPVLFIFLLSLLLRQYWLRDPRLKHLPPKVPGLPVINQTFYHMQDDLATNAIKWTREYGEIYRTRTGTTDWIWLNSGEAIKEIV